jgi:protein-arginine deiminase
MNRWVQDWLEIGEIRAPSGSFPALVESAWAPRSVRSGRTYAQAVLTRDGVMCAAKNPSRADLDRFGNLGVSPPIRVRGKDYPFGRIFYGGPLQGQRINSRFLKFLRKQSAQDPFEVDVSWLSLGHVDEVACFIPANDRRGFRLLLASPVLAMKLVRSIPAGERNRWTVCTGRLNGRAPYVTPVERTAQGLLADRQLCDYNERTIARRIEGVRAKMIRELGLRHSEILDVPVLFTRASSGRARPMTGNMVNMRVVVRRRCHLLVPKPWGPLRSGARVDLFERWLAARLRKLGCVAHFLDTWYTYHVGCGDLHCATVTLRSSPHSRAAERISSDC